MQCTDDPSLSQGQPCQALRATEVCLGQILPLCVIQLLQVEQDELAGIPQLVGEVAAGHEAVLGEVQILTGCCACIHVLHLCQTEGHDIRREYVAQASS